MNDKLDRIAGSNSRAELHYPIPSEAHYSLQEPEYNFQVHLLDYWKVMFKRWWIVLGTLLAFVAVSSFLTWRQTPIYRASLKLQIDNEEPSILPFKDAAAISYVTTEEFLKTQFEALTSRTLATRVVRAMDLERDPRFNQAAKVDMRYWLLGRVKAAFTWRKPKAPPVKPP